MTVQEAIELHLKPLKERAFAHTTETALNMAIESMEKQIPKKPRLEGEFFKFAHCPSCDNLIQFKQKYCPECGKAIDWEEGGTSD